MANLTAWTDEADRDAQGVNVPRLVVFRGDAVENEVHLVGNPVHVGRHVRNEVVLDDSLNGVSRFHAEIRPENGAYVIVDLNSRNGVWINGRRINTKAPLELGVPATVGAFELVLEDDASGASTGRLSASGQWSMPRHPTAPKPAALTRRGGRVEPAARTTPPARPRDRDRRSCLCRRQTVRLSWWSGAIALVVLICAVTFAIVRKPDPADTRWKWPRSPLPSKLLHRPATTSVAAEPPESPDKALNEQDLDAAREQMAAGQFAEALRDHVEPVLERDPENAAGLELKRQADEAVAAAVVKPKKPKLPQPEEVETPGIPRRAGEAYADYQTRARQVQVAFTDGKEKPREAGLCGRHRPLPRGRPRPAQ